MTYFCCAAWTATFAAPQCDVTTTICTGSYALYRQPTCISELEAISELTLLYNTVKSVIQIAAYHIS